MAAGPRRSFGLSRGDQWERWFGKAAYPLVFIAPNNFICLFAGAAGMRIGWFFAAKFRQPFDYGRFPFDRQSVWVRLRPASLPPRSVRVTTP
mgnify:CR=1 FL=1